MKACIPAEPPDLAQDSAEACNDKSKVTFTSLSCMEKPAARFCQAGIQMRDCVETELYLDLYIMHSKFPTLEVRHPTCMPRQFPNGARGTEAESISMPFHCSRLSGSGAAVDVPSCASTHQSLESGRLCMHDQWHCKGLPLCLIRYFITLIHGLLQSILGLWRMLTFLKELHTSGLTQASQNVQYPRCCNRGHQISIACRHVNRNGDHI